MTGLVMNVHEFTVLDLVRVVIPAVATVGNLQGTRRAKYGRVAVICMGAWQLEAELGRAASFASR